MGKVFQIFLNINILSLICKLTHLMVISSRFLYFCRRGLKSIIHISEVQLVVVLLALWILNEFDIFLYLRGFLLFIWSIDTLTGRIRTLFRNFFILAWRMRALALKIILVNELINSNCRGLLNVRHRLWLYNEVSCLVLSLFCIIQLIFKIVELSKFLFYALIHWILDLLSLLIDLSISHHVLPMLLAYINVFQYRDTKCVLHVQSNILRVITNSNLFIFIFVRGTLIVWARIIWRDHVIFVIFHELILIPDLEVLEHLVGVPDLV